MPTIDGPTGTTEPEPGWVEAETLVLARIRALTRWEAERWAAAHERRRPPISLLALRLSFLPEDADDGRADFLAAAFPRIEAAVAALAWVRPASDDDAGLAVDETVSAVIDVAQQALSAVVLAEEAMAGR